MKILIFTEGTIIMHKDAIGHTREEIVQQVKQKNESVHNYLAYVPIGNAVSKIKNWESQGAEIVYLTSRVREKEIENIQSVLDRYGFSAGRLLFRRNNEQYKDVAERIALDILIEDDCESIGGEDEMTITHISPVIKKKIKSIPIKEFCGIDHLPSNVSELLRYNKINS